MKSIFLQILQERGFINDCTDLAALDDLIVEKSARGDPLRAYIGFDLTAPSLHVGSLIQIMMIRWMRHCRHDPIILLGTFTTMVGDPTGKTSARPMLTKEEIDRNFTRIQEVIGWITELDPNYEGEEHYKENWWHEDFGFMEFLQKYGRHFSANRLLALDAVKSRVESENGISVLEMLYPMMQAVDFHELSNRYGVELQIGGSDQWGNITAGVDLSRRMRAAEGHEERKLFGLTTPLFTNSAGQKMGKTANGAIWLHPDMTSRHAFFQFWMNIEDAKVYECLKLFTELPLDQIDHLAGVNGPGIMEAKRVLAKEVTNIVHGDGAGEIEAKRSAIMFSSAERRGAPDITVEGMREATIAEVLVKIGLVKSNKEADRMAANGGVKMRGERVDDVRQRVPAMQDAADNITLSVGKKAFTVYFA